MTTVTTTPVTLNDGTAALVRLGNTGDPGKPAIISRAGVVVGTLNPGFTMDIKPNGGAITAVTASGTTTVTVDLTGVPPEHGGGGSTVTADGSGNLVIDGTTYPLTTDAELAAAVAALSGTYGPGSSQWLQQIGGQFGFAFVSASVTDTPTGLPTTAVIRWPDGTTGAFTGTIDGGGNGYSGFVATWVGATTKTLTASGITYDSVGTAFGPTGLVVS